MPLFGTKTIEVALPAFTSLLQAQPEFNQFAAVTSANAAKLSAQVFFDEAFKVQDAQGFWSAGGQPNNAHVAGPLSKIKFKTQQNVTTLVNTTAAYMGADAGKVNVKTLYAQTTLRAEATAGTLRARLTAKLEPEANYYTAPPPPNVMMGGHRPAPAPATLSVAKAKAKAWLKQGVVGSTIAYDQIIDDHVKGTARWPFGSDDTIVTQIWKQLVICPYRHRKFGMAASYPSSVGGMAILKKVIFDMSKMNFPAVGDTDWENWALYFFGAAMAVQAYPDGNKRVSRAVYAILMANADIPFRAPNGALGTELAAM